MPRPAPGGQPGPGDHGPAGAQSRPRARAGQRAGREPARRDRPDGCGRRGHAAPLRGGDPAHRRRRHRRGGAAGVRGRHRSRRRPAGPADRPGADDRLRADARPVQPPDGRLPADRGPGRRRVRRPAAHGGLRAVRPHAAERRAGGQRGRAAGVLPGRRLVVQAARRHRPAALRVAAAARVPAAGLHLITRVRPQRPGPWWLPDDPLAVPPGGVPPDRGALHRARRQPGRR